MNGFIAKSLTVVCLTGSLAGIGGCENYRNLVDPCYPERYEYTARKEVCSAFTPQVNNGHILDQTIWNYYFEAGTDKLTPHGQDQLDRIARRRPCPDPRLYLQTAQDLAYEPTMADKFPELRNTLDGKRIHSVQKYLAAKTADRPVPFEIAVHDPAEVGQAATVSARAIEARNTTALTVPQQVMTTAPGRFPGYGGVGGGSSGR